MSDVLSANEPVVSVAVLPTQAAENGISSSPSLAENQPTAVSPHPSSSLAVSRQELNQAGNQPPTSSTVCNQTTMDVRFESVKNVSQHTPLSSSRPNTFVSGDIVADDDGVNHPPVDR
jgi:hypothetical protein